MRKIDKNNIYVRWAVFNIYGGKCVYSDKPIEFMDMQLDHIIPESMNKDKENLNELLKRYGLGEDFELNSLYNLVPANRLENRRKSDLLYSNISMIHILEQASRKVPKIEKEIKKLKKNRNFEKDISGVIAHFEDDFTGKDKERAIERLVDLINNEETEFKASEQVYEFENENIYKRYTERIGIEATLPKYNNCETECVLYFKTLKLRDCKIILDNETILKELFSGIFTDTKYGIRRFIELDRSLNDELTPEDFENAVIKLGNNKIKLTYDDIHLLCEVIDSFARVYIAEIKEIENTLKTSRFPLSKRRNSYKFISVTPKQWYEITKFVRKHDVELGSSPWHIFDRTPPFSMIKVYTIKSHPKYEFGYHSFFPIEKDEDCVFHPSIASNKLVITWQFIEDSEKQGIEYLNERENWDAEYAYNWLINELLLKVGIVPKKKSIFNKSALELEELIENNKIEFIKYIKINKVLNKLELSDTISVLQLHFHRRSHDRYRVSKEQSINVYSLLISLIMAANKVDMYYICEKIGLGKCDTVDRIIEKLLELISNSSDKTMSGYNIDLILRAILSVLEDSLLNLDRRGVTDVLNQLDFLIDIYNMETLIDKYAVTYLDW